MNRFLKKIVHTTTFGIISVFTTVYPTHNVSRYFPFLERSEDYVIKQRSHLTPSFFIVDTATAFRRGGGTGGVPELWGNYDLNDVITSLETVYPNTPDPRVTVCGNNSLVGKSIRFHVHGKAMGAGVGLNYEQNLHLWGFQLGASLPLMTLKTTNRFDFDRPDSASIFQESNLFQQSNGNANLADRMARRQELTVDQIRRLTHQLIGFSGNTWSATGFGDLDAHLRWNKNFDHALLTKSIDLDLQMGVLMPTGRTSDVGYPCSLPFGSNGHWGLYTDFLTEIELKQDWNLGFLFGYAHLFPHTFNFRIPVGNEPAIFSTLIGRVKNHPGDTFKISPYFTLANLTDGLHFQLRYTYLRHNEDSWDDERSDKTIQSYLEKGGNLIAAKKSLSKWSCHYLTFELQYDTAVAIKHVTLSPVLFIGYDMPVNGNGFAKTHQLSMGAELHF